MNFDNIKKNIEDEDIDLVLWQIFKISPSDTIKLLELLKDLSVEDRERILYAIYESQDINYIASQMCVNLSILPNVLSFVLKDINIDFNKVLLFLLKNNILITFSCDRLLEVLNVNQEELDWKSIYTEYTNNIKIPSFEFEDYIVMKIRQYCGYAPIPEWCLVDNNPDYQDLKYYTEDLLILPEIFDDEMIKKQILPISVMMMEPTDDTTEAYKIDQILGPRNAKINQECVSGPRRCHMLDCMCFVLDKKDTIPDWFSGECIFCKNLIQRREFAVRYPTRMGSWWGCFCSEKCIYDFVKDAEQSDPDDKSHDLIEDVRLNIFFNILKTKGILYSLRVSLEE